MNEAKQVHDDLLTALLLIVPRTTYQDIRRLNTLAWAVTGLCLTHTVRLGAWTEVLESRATLAASRVRRFSRWLHHSAIDPKEWYLPVLQAALSAWPKSTCLYVALDTTALTPFVLICASLVYRGRAIPVAWRAIRRESGSTQVRFEDYRPVLDVVRLMLIERKMILLADCGFEHAQLISYLCRLQWSFRLRLKGNTLVRLSENCTSAMKDLCPPTGQKSYFQEVLLFGAGVGPVHLALACLLDHPDDPWYVASSEPANAKTLDEYSLRFDIEETFLDEKSGGFQLQTSELSTSEALERLLLVAAIATLHLTSLGVGVVQAGRRRWVDTHWDRGLSYLKIGWRWQQQRYLRGWQTFAPFWLDPRADSAPAIASRRAAIVAHQKS